MACPLPDVRRPAPGRRGAKLGEKPKGGPFHPGGHRLGKIGRANMCEPLVDASLSATSSMGRTAGTGTCRCDAADAGREVAPSGVSTVVPGAQRAPTPIAARMCGTRKSRRGPDLWSGRPTVRRAGFPGGRRMTEKRMPVAERQRETTTMMPVLQPVVVHNRPDTGLGARTRKRADAVR